MTFIRHVIKRSIFVAKLHTRKHLQSDDLVTVSSVYLGILAQAFYPIFPDFSKLGPLFKTS